MNIIRLLQQGVLLQIILVFNLFASDPAQTGVASAKPFMKDGKITEEGQRLLEDDGGGIMMKFTADSPYLEIFKIVAPTIASGVFSQACEQKEKKEDNRLGLSLSKEKDSYVINKKQLDRIKKSIEQSCAGFHIEFSQDMFELLWNLYEQKFVNNKQQFIQTIDNEINSHENFVKERQNALREARRKRQQLSFFSNNPLPHLDEFMLAYKYLMQTYLETKNTTHAKDVKSRLTVPYFVAVLKDLEHRNLLSHNVFGVISKGVVDLTEENNASKILGAFTVGVQARMVSSSMMDQYDTQIKMEKVVVEERVEDSRREELYRKEDEDFKSIQEKMKQSLLKIEKRRKQDEQRNLKEAQGLAVAMSALPEQEDKDFVKLMQRMNRDYQKMLSMKQQREKKEAEQKRKAEQKRIADQKAQQKRVSTSAETVTKTQSVSKPVKIVHTQKKLSAEDMRRQMQSNKSLRDNLEKKAMGTMADEKIEEESAFAELLQQQGKEWEGIVEQQGLEDKAVAYYKQLVLCKAFGLWKDAYKESKEERLKSEVTYTSTSQDAVVVDEGNNCVGDEGSVQRDIGQGWKRGKNSYKKNRQRRGWRQQQQNMYGVGPGYYQATSVDPYNQNYQMQSWQQQYQYMSLQGFNEYASSGQPYNMPQYDNNMSDQATQTCQMLEGAEESTSSTPQGRHKYTHNPYARS